LRRGLAAQKLRVTQATLSRDLQELRLIKLRKATSPPPPCLKNPRLCLRLLAPSANFLLDIRPAENLLVLKNASQRGAALAAAVDGAKFPEIAGTIAGDDTVLIITPNKKARKSLQEKIEALVK